MKFYNIAYLLKESRLDKFFTIFWVLVKILLEKIFTISYQLAVLNKTNCGVVRDA